MSYKVELLSAEDTAAAIRRITGVCGPYDRQRKMVLAEGFDLKGTFDLVARNIHTGEVEWEHSQDNIVTDYGRQLFAFNQGASTAGWAAVSMGFSPSTETPSIGRSALPSDSTQCVNIVVNTGGTVTAGTYTRTFSGLTSPSPATNRTLGTLVITPATGGVWANMGFAQIMAYAILTPAKIQTTVQTIELNYRISINPIV
jgi:hypothetical protein